MIEGSCDSGSVSFEYPRELEVIARFLGGRNVEVVV